MAVRGASEGAVDWGVEKCDLTLSVEGRKMGLPAKELYRQAARTLAVNILYPYTVMRRFGRLVCSLAGANKSETAFPI